jgi:hypothetical protein
MMLSFSVLLHWCLYASRSLDWLMPSSTIIHGCQEHTCDDCFLTDIDVGPWDFRCGRTRSCDSVGDWCRIDKDLYLGSEASSAWMYVSRAEKEGLHADSLVATGIAVGPEPHQDCVHGSWESRNGSVWVRRSRYGSNTLPIATGLDVLYGKDAVDPRPEWELLDRPLQLEPPTTAPIPSLTVRYAANSTHPAPATHVLQAKSDGKFKIVQISDMHMVTGPGWCNDAIDAHGHILPAAEADPLTTSFVRSILRDEMPDLVVLTGDQLHHDLPDSESALFKTLSSMIDHEAPFAAGFGNHDSEGRSAMSSKCSTSELCHFT